MQSVEKWLRLPRWVDRHRLQPEWGLTQHTSPVCVSFFFSDKLLLCFNFTACPEGYFGKNCSFSCKCKNGASCDPVSGTCRCPPGVSGDLCQDGEFPFYTFYFNTYFLGFTKNSFCSKILSNYYYYWGWSYCLRFPEKYFCAQAVLKVSMGSSATRSVTVPTTDAAIEPMEPVCVTLDSMGASVTFVSTTAYTSPASHPFFSSTT